MKAWEKLYKPQDLESAVELASDVSIKSNNGVEIIAEIEGYTVESLLRHGIPSFPLCNCPSRYYCKHEAALFYYFESHSESFLNNTSLDDIFNLIKHDDLKDFLINEFNLNPEFKEKFLKRFSDNVIDNKYYNNKLSKILRRGKDRNFDYNGFYNLDLMKDSLYDFMVTDITNIINIGDHDFACELLIRIGEVLNNEILTTFDSFYDLADEFMDNVNVLSYSFCLDAEKFGQLNDNTYYITQFL